MFDDNIIFVFCDQGNSGPIKIGKIYIDKGRGREIMSFEYDDKWLENVNNNRFFDPNLMFYKGRQYAPIDKSMFGIFADSCPDRWGRTLMKRRELIRARKEDRKPKRLTDIDYLLGVYDETRMGAHFL